MPVEFRDYYKVLGVPRGADADEVRRAFRKLARQHHPDVAKDKKRGEEKFKEINEAYEVLGDPEKRRKYDNLGADGRDGGFRAPQTGDRARPSDASQEAPFEFRFDGTGFSDFFEQLFGRGSARGAADAGPFTSNRDADAARPPGRGRAPSRRRGEDIEGDLLVTLTDALRGAVRILSLQRSDPRSDTAQTHQFRVRIPAGVREGQLIRVPGQGAAGQGGGRPGDLYLHVRYARHPDFRVEASDLYFDLDLAPWEAVLGATVTVPTLEGSVSLRIPPGTSSGQQLRVRGHGLPAGEDVRGNLLVIANVRVPTQLTPAERKLWETLAHESGFRPRDETSSKRR